METEGINLDVNFLKNLSKKTTEELNEITKKIFELSGEEFNISSPKQLGEILFDELGLKGGRKTKMGNYSTDSNVLEELASDNEIIAKHVLDWRELSKLKSTYTDALVGQISSNICWTNII